MSTRIGLISLRQKFEAVFAGVLFAAAATLVLSGALAMCVLPS